ncbi:hypothetical protein SDC9_165720 [bioreactor metagenome]|uniref:Uncharacterized protein n=1 Tax=bioreactor metagenome TaxID=1076179 RepID=A0A645FXI6_9ZZZZ
MDVFHFHQQFTATKAYQHMCNSRQCAQQPFGVNTVVLVHVVGAQYGTIYHREYVCFVVFVSVAKE